MVLSHSYTTLILWNLETSEHAHPGKSLFVAHLMGSRVHGPEQSSDSKTRTIIIFFWDQRGNTLFFFSPSLILVSFISLFIHDERPKNQRKKIKGGNGGGGEEAKKKVMKRKGKQKKERKKERKKKKKKKKRKPLTTVILQLLIRPQHLQPKPPHRLKRQTMRIPQLPRHQHGRRTLPARTLRVEHHPDERLVFGAW